MTINNRRMRVNDVELNIVTQGEGPAVLLVHGFPDDYTVWRNQIPALVDAGYRVIALDTRGCGESEIKPRESDYAIDKLVADLVGLLDALGIAKVRLVGHDWGALQGWYFAMQHPERVDRYIAMSVGHPGAYVSAGMAQKLKGYYLFCIQLRGLIEFLVTRFDWLLFRIIASLPGRVSAHQGATVASRATDGGLQLLPREPAPDAQQDLPARESSGCRHLE